MNFYVDSGGAILGVDPEKIYQGSANANTIRFVGAFASNVKVTVAFKLPTGVWTTPQLMTASTQLAGVVTSNGVQFNVWEYSIPALVTETFGTVNIQFYVYGDAGNGNGGLIATASSSFQVERGVPITLPDPTDDYETLLTQILSALSQIEGQIPGMEEDITGLQSKVSDLSENKLDKVSGNTTYKQAYAKDTNGDQIMQNYSTENVTNAIVQRDETGNIKITPGRKGYMNDGATMRNIADVESEVAKKYDKTGGTIDGNVQITGDLNVDGTTTTNDTETLQVKDNFIVTNADGTPLNSLSGIVIRTNANTTYAIVYDPISDSVKLGEGTYTDGKFTFLEGEGEAVAVRDDSTAFTDKHVIVWDAAGDKFVDGGKDVSDLPTLAGNNDFTGENSFSDINFTGTLESKTDDHQFSVTYRENNGYMVLVKYGNQYATYTQGPGTIVNDNTNKTQVYYFYDHVRFNRNDQSSVYNFIFHGRTIENGIHNFYLPNKTGTYDLATTDDIPTDYATQTALANTQRQVDGLYTLLEQKNEIYVQTATDTYTTRETAGGENIADGVQTPVKKITGATVKTTNLFNASALDGYSASDRTLTVTFDSSGNSHIEVNGGLAYNTIKLRDACPGITAGTYTFSATFEASSPYENSSGNIYLIETNKFILRGSGSASGEHALSTTVEITSEDLDARVEFFGSGPPNGPAWWDNLTCSAGSSALPYMPYFSGLKNAFFKEIVSTGRNLIPYPYAETTKTVNGVTFTVNTDGTITVNGTATALTTFWLFSESKNLPLGMSVGEMYTISLKGGSDNCYIYTNYVDSTGEAHGANLSSNTGNTPTNTVGEEWKGLQIYIVVTQDATLNNVTVYPMLNYGSSALPYEPYSQSVLSLPEAVENGEWNTIDIENGKNISQGFTKTFDGTENIQRTFKIYDYGSYPVLNFRPQITGLVPESISKTNLICNIFNAIGRATLISEKVEGICEYTEGSWNYSVFLFRINPIIYGCTMDSTDDELIAGFKAYLAAQSEAGNPLVVRYKTEEIQSTTDISPSADSYIAWKNGSETIEQGDTDNSIYGAENTVEQDYYLLTAPEEVTKE